MNGEGTLFREEQRWPEWWVLAITLGLLVSAVALVGYGVVQQLILGKPWGHRPMPDTGLAVFAAGFTVLTLAVLLLIFASRLETEVRPAGLYVRFFPVHLSFRRFGWGQIERFGARTYSPMGEFLGWGIRFGPRGRAYNMSGNRGVQLWLRGGRRLLIGSQRAEELAEAMERASSRRQEETS